MLSKQEEQQERLQTLENDRKVLEAEQARIQREGTTFHQFGQSQADEISQGRFAATGVPSVTGAMPIPKYPAASPSWQIQLPDEPPLGLDNPALETSAASILPAEATGGAEAPSPASDVEQAAPPPSSNKQPE
jgi:hypothetical protein